MVDNAAVTSFVEIPGVRIAYEMTGEGATLVFLNGGLLDRRQWDGQFPVFAERYRVIRYDMRSTGQSETAPSNDPFTHHEDLFRFLRAVNVDKASLVGLSNNAVALDFAIAFPKMVEKLVLVSPGLRGYRYRDPWLADKSAAMMHSLACKDTSAAVETFLNMWVDGPHRQPAEVDAQVRERVREMASHGFRMSRLAPNCKGLEPLAAERLGEVQAPTSIALGDKDVPDIHAIGKLLHEGIPGSRLVWIRGAGHTFVMEKPEEFNRLLERSLFAT